MNRYYNAESNVWQTEEEIINIIIEQGYTEEEAKNHIDYSIKHRILYTVEDYNKHFAQYEN